MKRPIRFIWIIIAAVGFGHMACEPPPGYTSGVKIDSTTTDLFGDLLTDPNMQQIYSGIMGLSSEVSELARPNQVQAWVDQLIVKAQPGKDMPEVAKMAEGEIATYLYQRTVRTTEYNLRGQRFNEPWILIRTKDSLMGWVHEGGVRYLENNFTSLLNSLTAPASSPAANQRTRGVNPGSQNPIQNKFILPGKQLGPIKVTTAESELIQLFGAHNVARGQVKTFKGNESCTIVNANSNDEMRITWTDDSRGKIKAIYLDRTGSNWFTQQGLRVGIGLDELAKINQAPFSFRGFGSAYSGTVESWRSGVLKRYDRGFYVQLAPAVKNPNKTFTGDKVYSSNEKGVEQLGIYVKRIVVYLD